MKKYANIDIAKFIMAIFVVIIHTLPFFSVKNNLILNINEAIIRCAVPFFFMASGFLIFDKGNDGLKSHIKKLIKIYLILTLMYLPLTIYGYVSSGTPFISACKNFVLQFFCRGENYFSWPLWYILSSIYAFIAIFIMKKMKLKDWHILSISFLVFIFAHTMTYFTANVASLYETPIYIYIYIYLCGFFGVEGYLRDCFTSHLGCI